MSSGAFAQVSEADAAVREVTLLRGGRTTAGRATRARPGTALGDAIAGRLRPVIGQTFPLERAADAHAAIEGARHTRQDPAGGPLTAADFSDALVRPARIEPRTLARTSGALTRAMMMARVWRLSLVALAPSTSPINAVDSVAPT